jgi:NitT/TauT family transport system permease protein
MAQSISLSKQQTQNGWWFKLLLQVSFYIILLLIWNVQARIGILPKLLDEIGFYTPASRVWDVLDHIGNWSKLLVEMGFYIILLLFWYALARIGIKSKLLRQIGFYIILLLAWDGLARGGIWQPFLFVGPIDVGEALFSNLQTGVFFTAILTSVSRLAIGYSISLILGICLGLFIGLNLYAKETLGSLVLGFQALPSVCWVPVALLWFSLSENAMIFVVVMGALFSIIIGVEAGVKNTPPVYIKAARNMGAKGLNLAIRVVFPAALPSIITGLKQGWTFAWRSLLAAELIYATVSLGGLLEAGRSNIDMPQIFAVMVTIIVVGVLIDSLIFGPLERTVRLRWGFSQE